MRNLWSLTGAIAVAGFLSCASVAAQPEDLVTFGRQLVEANCARCHAVGLKDESTHPEAPAFRTLSERYPIDALEEAFAEGIVVGHPDMPEFIAEPDQIDAIIAYIETLQK